MEPFEDTIWPVCIGLVRIGMWDKKEVWNDLSSRPIPWYLHLVPYKYISYNRKGAKLCLNRKNLLLHS